MKAHRVVKAAFSIGVITGFSLVLGLARNVVTARGFGATRELDAYLVAAILPNFLLYLFGIDLLRGIATSLFSGSLAVGDDHERQRLFSSLFNTILVVGMAATAVAGALMPLIVGVAAAGFSPADQVLAVRLAYMMLPMALLLGLGSYLAAILNAYRRFALPATLRMAPHAVVIVTILTLASGWGVYSIALGMVLGSAVSAFSQWVGCYLLGLRWRPILDFRHPAVRRAAKMALPLLILAAMGQLGQLLQRMLGSYLTPGKISALSYALLLVGLAIRVGSEPITTVLLPEFAEHAARRNGSGVQHLLRRGLAANFLIMAPVTVVFCLLAPDIVQLIYERGEFGPEATQLAAGALRWMAVGLVFWGVWLLQVRVYLATQETGRMAVLGGFAHLVLYGASIGLVFPLDYIGLAIAFSLYHVAHAAAMSADLKHRLGTLDARALLNAIAWGTVACAAMALVLLMLVRWAGPAPPGVVAGTIRLVTVGAPGALAYLIVLGIGYQRSIRPLLASFVRPTER